MSYQETCIFDMNRRYPLYMRGIELSGELCNACIDSFALKGAFKAQIISQLLIIFHNKEKAKEAFDEIMKCVEEW